MTTLKKSVEIINNQIERNSNYTTSIYIESSSPDLLEFARRTSDGALISASHPKDYKEISNQIKKLKSTRQNDIDKFDIIAYTCTSISKDITEAKNAAKIVVAFIIAGSSPQVLERHQVSNKLHYKIYSNLCKGNIGGTMHLIDDSLLNKFSITGTPDEIINRISSLEETGVTQYVAGAPIGRDIKESIKLFEEVIPSF